MKLFILATIQNPPTFFSALPTQETLILDTFFNVKGGQGTDKSKKVAQLQDELTTEEVTGFLFSQDEKAKLLSFKIVAKPQVRWISGEYYAHEYDEYVEGRARIVKWTESFHELEVECLDKSKRVADGIWEFEDTSSGTQNNGCGDKFLPSKRLK
nr:hypothetical protein [Vibrio splendidus]MCC4883054.1 hypothetical protein [Vibrio splendidus]